jgi:hypothetical protein
LSDYLANMAELEPIFNKVKTRKEFITEGKKLGYKESQLNNIFYKLKKVSAEGSNRTVGSMPSGVPGDQTAVSSIPKEKVLEVSTPIQVTANKELPEAQELADAYKNMAQGAGVETVGGQPGEEGQQPLGEGEMPEPERERNLRIQLGQLLKTIGVTIDDQIWKERPLTEDEKDQIQQYSEDIETEFGTTLDSEYSPYINYVLATFIAPMIARIDLIPLKFYQAQQMFKGPAASPFASKGAPASQSEAERVQEADTKKAQEMEKNGMTEEFIRNNNMFSDNVKNWFYSEISAGKRISPRFKNDMPIDKDAYNKGTLRNVGDPFS